MAALLVLPEMPRTPPEDIAVPGAGEADQHVLRAAGELLYVEQRPSRQSLFVNPRRKPFEVEFRQGNNATRVFDSVLPIARESCPGQGQAV